MAAGDKVFIADKKTLDEVHANTVGILAAVGDGAHKHLKRYGIKIAKGNSGKDARVEYILDAVGMTPAKMDYDLGVFNYGSWENVGFVSPEMNYPCMLKADGTEDYKLDPNDYSLKEGSGLPSDVANIDYDGNAMAAFVGGWLCQFETKTDEYIIWCAEQFDETYKAYHRMTPDGEIRPGFYRRIYTPTEALKKAKSISGQQPMYSKNATQERELIKANGEAYEHTSWSEYNYITCLLKIMGKTEDCQTAFGNGNMNGYVEDPLKFYGVLKTGTLDNKGQFFGSRTNNEQVKVFHTEAMWGDQYERLIGLVCDHGKLKVSPYGPYNFNGTGYHVVTDYIENGVVKPGDGYKGGYTKDTIVNEYGRFTKNWGGSTSTYLCDYHAINPDILSVALVGGYASYGAACGPGCVNLSYTVSGAYWSIAPGLSYKMPVA